MGCGVASLGWRWVAPGWERGRSTEPPGLSPGSSAPPQSPGRSGEGLAVSESLDVWPSTGDATLTTVGHGWRGDSPGTRSELDDELGRFERDMMLVDLLIAEEEGSNSSLGSGELTFAAKWFDLCPDEPSKDLETNEEELRRKDNRDKALTEDTKCQKDTKEGSARGLLFNPQTSGVSETSLSRPQNSQKRYWADELDEEILTKVGWDLSTIYEALDPEAPPREKPSPRPIPGAPLPGNAGNGVWI